jgi:hypothetical protein
MRLAASAMLSSGSQVTTSRVISEIVAIGSSGARGLNADRTRHGGSQ